MKIMSFIFAAIGAMFLGFVIIGKLLGHPGIFLGVKLLSLLMIANTAFLLAVLFKLSEKK